MRVVAVIPARGGSKRVPRKNIRQLGLKPLLAYSILAAKAAHLVDRVIVSTDDDEIASVAELWGAEVHRRPAYTATDDAPIESCLWSVYQWLGDQGPHTFDYPCDYMVTLQPSVPLRREGLIDDVIKRCVELDADSAWTAQADPACWYWSLDKEGEWADQCTWRRMAPPQQRHQVVRSGLLWRHDGSVCVSHESLIRKGTPRDRMGGRTVPYVCERSCDIDTEADLRLAEALLSLEARRVEAA